jgi:hypothetical protein
LKTRKRSYIELETLMSKFDKLQSKFKDDVIFYVDLLFNWIDPLLEPSQGMKFSKIPWSADDADTVGPGITFENYSTNPRGEDMNYGHKEWIHEGYMLRSGPAPSLR